MYTCPVRKIAQEKRSDSVTTCESRTARFSLQRSCRQY